VEPTPTPEQLYALPPEDFTAARDAAAKQAKAGGDADRAKRLKALRRPSVSAWLVNRLAREQTDLLGQLLELGPALAAAQAARSGDELRALGEQRRQLVEAVVEQAVAGAARPVATAVRAEVAATLEAALADPASADAVRSGLLVRALSFAGFGGVDLEGAVAAPSPPVPAQAASPAKGRRVTARQDDERERRRAEQVAAAERAAHEAAGALDDAVRRCEDLERARGQAQDASTAAGAEVERLEQRLADARRQQAEAVRAAADAEEQSARAVTAVERAQTAAEAARSALDRLRRE
jgi:hypothetical protein